jgi:hypothetical protein
MEGAAEAKAQEITVRLDGHDGFGCDLDGDGEVQILYADNEAADVRRRRVKAFMIRAASPEQVPEGETWLAEPRRQQLNTTPRDL